MPEVGELVVVAKADVASLQQAMNNIRRSLGDVSRSTKSTLGNFSVLGSVLTGAVAGGTMAAVSGITNLTKSLLDFASASPDMQVATVGLNEQLRQIAYDLGPEAANVINSITNALSTVWEGGGREAFIALLSGLADLINGFTQLGGIISGLFGGPSETSINMAATQEESISGINDIGTLNVPGLAGLDKGSPYSIPVGNITIQNGTVTITNSTGENP